MTFTVIINICCEKRQKHVPYEKKTNAYFLNDTAGGMHI